MMDGRTMDLPGGDWNLATLFPEEVAEARARTGPVLLPVAPIEWHGPHLAMGCDGLLAHAFARRLARDLRPETVALIRAALLGSP